MSRHLQTDKEKVFLGKGISHGLAAGRALVIETGDQLIFRRELPRYAVKRELARVKQAIERSKHQLLKIKKRLTQKLGRGHAYILDAHILMLQDKLLLKEIFRLIGKERSNAEWAVKEASEQLVRAYASLKDEFFRERGNDIEDVVNRILMNLAGIRKSSLSWLWQNSILIAKDLNPSILAALDYNKVKAFALEAGSDTSHTAILARSLGIPAVIHLGAITTKISSGDRVVVDGSNGKLIASPMKTEIKKLGRKAPEADYGGRSLPCVTLDGHNIHLEANIEMISQVHPALRMGAEGIGLFRSEFILYQNREAFPSEEKQFRMYKRLAELVRPYPATIRTFDFGGDKTAHLHTSNREMNPALGLRGIRLSLSSKSMFENQIRAILRASAYGQLRIVLPLVSRVEEVTKARETIRSIAEDLRRQGLPFDANLPLGVMIEVPAAVLLADRLCQHVDFFCIGTNDLIQYTLAVDRVDKKVCHLFEPFHPSVLQSISLVAKAAKKRKIEVKACGQAAANPIYAAVLLGMGIDSFSLNLNSIPTIHQFMKSVTLGKLIPLAKRASLLPTAAEVERYVIRKVGLSTIPQ